MKVIEFESDKVLVKGPKADNTYQITFEVGEYMLPKIKDFVVIVDKVMKVKVVVE